jgi:hypothetical protein
MRACSSIVLSTALLGVLVTGCGIDLPNDPVGGGGTGASGGSGASGGGGSPPTFCVLDESKLNECVLQ